MPINPQIKLELKKVLKQRMSDMNQKVVIVSSYPMSRQDKSDASAKIPQLPKGSEIEYQVDERLLGGVVVKIGSKLIDLSLKGQLNNLKQKLYENP